MNQHPTDEKLQSWLDGATENSQDEEITNHVEVCSRCQQLVESVEQLQVGLRSWADHEVPELPADFADSLVAKAFSSQQDNVIAFPSDGQNLKNTGKSTSGGRKRVWMTAPAVLAAAAVALFAVRMTGNVQNTQTNPSRTNQIAQLNRPETHPTAGNGTSTDTSVGHPSNPTNVAINDGSEVVSVDVGAGGSQYSVFEVEGVRAGSSVAVVWIEEE